MDKLITYEWDEFADNEFDVYSGVAAVRFSLDSPQLVKTFTRVMGTVRCTKEARVYIGLCTHLFDMTRRHLCSTSLRYEGHNLTGVVSLENTGGHFLQPEAGHVKHRGVCWGGDSCMELPE